MRFKIVRAKVKANNITSEFGCYITPKLLEPSSFIKHGIKISSMTIKLNLQKKKKKEELFPEPQKVFYD